jgi:hypothetical protein
MSILKCTFLQIFIAYIFQVYIPNPIEYLGRIERIGKVAIIKQQIESMCIYEALLENAKHCRQETHLQQDVDF